MTVLFRGSVANANGDVLKSDLDSHWFKTVKNKL